MNRVIYKYFVIALCMIIFCGCDLSEDNETSNNHQIIKLAITEVTYGPPNSLTIGELIRFDVINTSEKHIWFPPNFNVALYVRTNGQWVPIENDFDHGPFENTLGPWSSLHYSTTLYVFPDIPDNSIPIEMHMTVTGFIVENDVTTNETVSAEIDFVLSP